MTAMLPLVLDEAGLTRAIRLLSRRDPMLAHAVKTYGPPPMWDRAPGFATLIHIILEQQVSLASAQAAFDKLRARLGDVTPIRFLSLDDSALRADGFSRQKALYGRGLATAILSGALDLDALATQPDEQVSTSLMTIKGIGRWTSDIYLLMVLRRADVLPRGDIALYTSFKELSGGGERPTPDAFEDYAERWRPYRAVGARILWQAYLERRRKPVLARKGSTIA
jgi:DNA-3-methyladenine glycosylase II